MPNLSYRSLPFLPALLCLAPAIHAADAAPACRYVPIATLPIRASARTMQPTVEGQIDGRPAVMLLDTGTGPSRLTLAATEKFKLQTDNTGKYIFGIGGAAVNYAARVRDFSVGPAHSGKAVLPVLGKSAMADNVDAIIGADFILQMDLEIALADKQLKFFRAEGCKDTFLAYWDANAMEIPFGGTSFSATSPRFIVELNGVRLEALIGTGAQRSVVTRKAAERVGVKIDSPGVTPAGKAVGIGAEQVARWATAFDTFSIGSETIQNAQIDILDTPPQGGTVGMPDILLGADFLRAHRVLFAMSQQRLYVSYTGGEVFAKRASTP